MQIKIDKAERWPNDSGFRAESDLRNNGAGVYAYGESEQDATTALFELLARIDGDGRPLDQPRVEPLHITQAEVAVDQAAIQSLVDGAISAGKKIRLTYKDREGSRTVRDIDPKRWRREARWQSSSQWAHDMIYLVARDLRKDEIRSFRLDRIERAEIV